MQKDFIEFNFVYSKDALQTKEFLDKVPRSIECINYMTISNKLVKNDYFQIEASDVVISSYLIKSLQQSLSNNTTRCLYYVISNMDEKTLINITDYVQTLSDFDFVFNLYYSKDTDKKYINDSKSIIKNKSNSSTDDYLINKFTIF